MLKIIENTKSIIEPKKTEAGINSNSIIDDSKIINQISSTKRKNQAKITNSKTLIKSKNHDFLYNFQNIEARPGFFIFKARLTFIKLR